MEIIIEAWRQFQWKDLIDIFVVAFVLYQFLKVVRGTRSMQMVIGLFLLSFISIIGKFYDLYSISWLLENFFESFIIILVILFQSEIRAHLLPLPTVKLLAPSEIMKTKKSKPLKSSSVWALKDKKIGAIIALQNSKASDTYHKQARLLMLKLTESYSLYFNPKGHCMMAQSLFKTPE